MLSEAAYAVSLSRNSSAPRWSSSRVPAEQVWLAVAEGRGGDGGQRQIEVGVGEDDDRGLAAQLGDGGHHVGRGGLGDLDAGRHRAGEGDLVDVRVAGQGGSRLAVAGDDVQDAWRQAALQGDPADLQRGERGFGGRLEHHRAARGECRGGPASGVLERVVERDDLAGDADRLADRVVDQAGPEGDRRAAQLVGYARVELEVAGRRLDIGLGLAERFADVLALQAGQPFALVADGLGDPVEDPATVGCPHTGPLGGREGRAGRRHRLVHVRLTGQRYPCEGLPVRRVEDGEGATVGGGHLLAVDEKQPGVTAHGRISPWTSPKMTTSSPGRTVRMRRTQSTMPSCGARTSSSVLP